MRTDCRPALLLLLACWLPAAMPETIRVELVSNLDSGQLVSGLEDLLPVTETTFDANGSHTRTIGSRAVLWVRNAHIDGRFFFERYYEGKYIGRESQLQIAATDLGVGEHLIEPGAHRFTLAADGTLSSDDVDIRIVGNAVRLRLHAITVYTVDGAKQGPPTSRMLATELGLFATQRDFKLDPAKLPDPTKSRNPQDPTTDKFPLTNLLSQAEKFSPLTIWLPASELGQGYLLYPSWQSFHLLPDGRPMLGAGGAQTIPGITATDTDIVVTHRKFSGVVNSRSGLRAGVGAVYLADQMNFSATLAPVTFRAGLQQPDERFFLPVETDFSRRPNKHFVADNMAADPHAVRLLALEWDEPIMVAGSETELGLRLLQTPAKATLVEPTAALRWSVYNPRSPAARTWQDADVLSWSNDVGDGALRVRIPATASGFVIFSVVVHDRGAPLSLSTLRGEIPAYVLRPQQTGTASISSTNARDAFVAGESIRLSLHLRSAAARPAANRRLLLQRGDETVSSLTFQDSGAAALTVPLLLPATATEVLPHGAYELRVDGLPHDIESLPFAFDVVGRDQQTQFMIIKPSKYTEPMNNLVPSHIGRADMPPIDLDRAMQTLFELGYNRVDLMTYITNHHVRRFTWREDLAAADPRLPAADDVFTPSPRHQLLNDCVRHHLAFADVFLSYNDFHLPRYIEGYTNASARWLAREVQDMRASPAFAGMILYDEMYEQAVTGLAPGQQKQWAALRHKLAESALGQSPAKIEAAINQFVSRPPSQREPAALQHFYDLRNWEQLGWRVWSEQVLAAAGPLAPAARYTAYRRTFMLPGQSDGFTHGYPPDLFAPLDLASHVHYADNSTGWVHIPIIAQLHRAGKPLYVNLPVSHEIRTQYDGQYQRMMAFALLAQGANGICMWGLPTGFDDGPNPVTATARETTRQLNQEILAPFGDLVNETRNGYQRIGIVSTLGQHVMSEFKDLPVSHQTEEIWTACWRLGYPAVFLRETDFRQPLRGFDVIFVPGIRFGGELSEQVLSQLQAAAAAGTKVVVEQGSTLDLAGVIKLDDWPLNSFYLGMYFPTWHDDELNKVYQTSQFSTHYLRDKFAEWGVEPGASGPFRVGPGWRDGGEIDYLIMANFDDPDYGHTVKQQMAKPIVLPLTVAAHRGRVAYDLLRRQQLPLTAEGDRLTFELDLTRMQGGLVAFLPAAVARFEVGHARRADGRELRLSGTLHTADRALDGLFPVSIRLDDQIFFRVCGQGREITLALTATGKPITVEVTELLSGRVVTLTVPAPAASPGTLALMPPDQPIVPYPAEVASFLETSEAIRIVPAASMPGAATVATELASLLHARGSRAEVVAESDVWHFPSGDAEQEDPFNDGYHSWRSGHELIAPATVVDAPVILLAAPGGSFLLDGLITNGYLSERPAADPTLPFAPSLQVAHHGLHWQYATLCIIARDAAGLRQAVQRLVSPPSESAAAPKPAFDAMASSDDSGLSARPPAIAHMGSNEMINALDFDAAGNLYVGTWGHGQNLYSFDTKGGLRFAGYLPEMGVRRVDVFADRLLAFTAAGARLYQLQLDGTPISQARLGMDPGSTSYRDDYALAVVNYDYLPEQRLLVYRAEETMRVVTTDMSIQAEWPSERFSDKDVTDELMARELHGFAVSPDGTRIAQFEASYYFTRYGNKDQKVYDTHLVVRDLSGTLLHEYANISNATKVRDQLEWAPGAPGPVVRSPGIRRQFDATLQLLVEESIPDDDFYLGAGERLLRDGRELLWLNAGNEVQARLGPFAILPTFVAVSADRGHLVTLDEYGRLHCFAADGQRQGTVQVGELGKILRFAPDGKTFYVGGTRGGLQAYSTNCELLWQVRLGKFNTTLGVDVPLHDDRYVDYTDKLWPSQRDEPEQLERSVRLGTNRLTQGAFEVGAEFAGESITSYLGQHVTWVLEFEYQAAAADCGLIAGVQVRSRYPDAVARELQATSAWQFARIAVKSGRDCEQLATGFQSPDGTVRIRNASLRRVRFPSVNHLLYDPLHDVDPAVLENPLFSRRYDPFGNLREEAPNKVLVQILRTGAMNLIESAFLQNGRLNDVGSKWYVQPFGDPSTVSMALAQPRWISMVALYFDAYKPSLVTPHFDVLVTDIDSEKEQLVASIRHNRQLFRIVDFPPIKTSMIKLRLVNSIARLRTLTEIEVYGPLSGKQGEPGFADADGQNTYMGDFTRVDKRAKPLASSYGQPQMQRQGHGDAEYLWNPPLAQVLASEDHFYISRALGLQGTFALAEPAKRLAAGHANGIGFAPYGTLYGGLLLRCGNDGLLYCISPESGTTLWSVKLGERLFGCPVVIREDIYLANEVGRLYQIDSANGSIMKDVALPAGVFGSLATDGSVLFSITADGWLRAHRVDDLNEIWTCAVAPDTDATPAVDGGVVYLADQQGIAMAVSATDGSVRWRSELGQEFCRCPVVLADRILYGCRQGRMVALARDSGKQLWSRDLDTRFQYEPLVLGDRVLYFVGGEAFLTDLNGGQPEPLTATYQDRKDEDVTTQFNIGQEPAVPLSYYKGHLFAMPRHGDNGHTIQQINYPWHVVGGTFHIMVPTPEPKAEEPPK